MEQRDLVTVQVPKGEKEKWKKVFYRQLAMDDPELKIIYEEIENNPNMPISEIASALRKKLPGRNIRKDQIKRKAIRWGLDFTE